MTLHRCLLTLNRLFFLKFVFILVMFVKQLLSLRNDTHTHACQVYTFLFLTVYVQTCFSVDILDLLHRNSLSCLNDMKVFISLRNKFAFGCLYPNKHLNIMVMHCFSSISLYHMIENTGIWHRLFQLVFVGLIMYYIGSIKTSWFVFVCVNSIPVIEKVSDVSIGACTFDN